MDTYRRVHLGVGMRHDFRHRTAGRKTGDIDATGIHVVLGDDIARDAGDERWLAAFALLVRPLELVPAARRVGRGRLFRVHNDESVLVRQRIHPRSGGKIIRILLASVEHHDERPLLVRV